MELNKTVKIVLMASVLVFAVWYTGLIPLHKAEAAPGDLTKTITRVFPDGNYVGFRLVLTDDGVTVIDKTYMEQWASGTSVQLAVKQKIGARMQADIDAYKALATRFNHADYETARGQIDAGLNL